MSIAPELVGLNQTHPYLEEATIVRVPGVISLDVDGLLSDTNRLMEQVYVSAETIGIDPLAMRIERESTNKAKPFAPLSYIKDRHAEQCLDPDQSEALIKQFLHHSIHGHPDPRDIMYPDAQRLIQRLQQTATPHFANTYGIYRWQAPKVIKIGKMSYIIADTPDKAPPMQAIFSDDGKAYFHDSDSNVVYKGGTVTHFDDKAAASRTLPQESRYNGIWVQRLEAGQTEKDLLPRQQGSVPPNVQVARSLDQAYQNVKGEWVVDLDRTAADAESEIGLWTPPKQVFVPLSNKVEIVEPDPDLPHIEHSPVVRFRIR